MWEPISKMTWEFGPALDPTAIDYGMGWMLGEIDGRRIVDHGGFDEGYAAMILLAPDDDLAVTMNSSPAVFMRRLIEKAALKRTAHS
jgi:hypothetical protein